MKTHFGYQTVTEEEKTEKVKEVFHSVADRYDVMNDMMSLGVHRLWKKFLVNISRVRLGEKVLDVASGTGDLACQFAKRVGDEGQVILTDINESMLRVGKNRLLDKGIFSNVKYVIADAEQLPFPDNYFDCITIAFGLRNVTRKENALESMHRILKPGGRLLVMEFSQITMKALRPAYDRYSFDILPKLGELIAGDKESYQYLAESIRKHPDQEALKTMMSDAGFDACDYHNLTAGIVAIHRGYKC